MSYWRLYYHLVWGTKLRMPLIGDGRKVLLRRSIRDSCPEKEIILHEVGTMPDHVHLAASIPPRYPISDIVQLLKEASGRLLASVDSPRRLDPFGWQREYGVVSFDEEALDSICAYVRNQPTHHAAHSLIPKFETLEKPYEQTNPPA
jgi:putative transposase